MGVFLPSADPDVRAGAHLLTTSIGGKHEKDETEQGVACGGSCCPLGTLSAAFAGHGLPFGGDEKGGDRTKPRPEDSAPAMDEPCVEDEYVVSKMRMS